MSTRFSKLKLAFLVAVALASTAVTGVFAGGPPVGSSTSTVSACGSGTGYGNQEYYDAGSHSRTWQDGGSCTDLWARQRIWDAGTFMEDTAYSAGGIAGWAYVSYPTNWTNATAKHTFQKTGASGTAYTGGTYNPDNGVYHASCSWYQYGDNVSRFMCPGAW